MLRTQANVINFISGTRKPVTYKKGLCASIGFPFLSGFFFTNLSRVTERQGNSNLSLKSNKIDFEIDFEYEFETGFGTEFEIEFGYEFEIRFEIESNVKLESAFKLNLNLDLNLSLNLNLSSV